MAPGVRKKIPTLPSPSSRGQSHPHYITSEGAHGRFPFDQKFRNFRNEDKWCGKVSENLEIVEVPKSKPFNRKFWKFRDENQMERKFPGKFDRKFG